MARWHDDPHEDPQTSAVLRPFSPTPGWFGLWGPRRDHPPCAALPATSSRLVWLSLQSLNMFEQRKNQWGKINGNFREMKLASLPSHNSHVFSYNLQQSPPVISSHFWDSEIRLARDVAHLDAKQCLLGCAASWSAQAGANGFEACARWAPSSLSGLFQAARPKVATLVATLVASVACHLEAKTSKTSKSFVLLSWKSNHYLQP